MSDLVIGDVRPRVQYTADGVQTAFAFPFSILDADDLVVAFDDGEAAAAYSVSGVGDSAGGDVTFAAPPPADTRVTLYRDMAFARETDFQEGGDFRAAVINAELDRMAMLLQQAGMTVGDTLRKHPYDLDDDLLLPPAAERAGKVLAFDEDGLPSALTAPATSAADAAASAASAASSQGAAQASAAAAAASAASAASAAQSTFSVFAFTAAGGETAVSGADDAGRTLAYAPGALLVALNGAMLVPGTDFTATDGTSIAGLAALAPGDVVSAVAFGTFSILPTSLQALSNVTPYANGLPYYTGEDSAAITNLSTAARTLLAAETALELRALVGPFAPHFGGYSPGRYYSGFGSNIFSTATTILSADTLYSCTFVVGIGTTFNRISCEVTSPSSPGQLIRLGIYNRENGVPSSLVLDAGTIVADAVAIHDLSIDCPLPVGAYCLVMLSDGSPTVRAATMNLVTNAAIDGNTTLGSATATSLATGSCLFGSMPENFGSVTFISANVPQIVLGV